MVRAAFWGFLLAGTALGGTAPDFPAKGRCPIPVEGVTHAQFILRRKADSACTSDLAAAERAYRDSRRELVRLVETSASGDEIARMERRLVTRRAVWHARLGECGDCWAAPTRRIEGEELDGQVWYESDGFCEIPFTAPGPLERAWSAATDFLLSVGRYPREKLGFPHVARLVAVDFATGALRPEVKELSVSPTHLWVLALGPRILELQSGFTYFNELTFERVKWAADAEMLIRARTVRPPRGFVPPRAEAVNVAGEREIVATKSLSRVKAQWYLDGAGHLRYWTAAEFRAPSKFVEESGQALEMATLARVYEELVFREP